MAKLDRQLGAKLEAWAAAGLITPEQAQAIRAREAEGQPGRPWGMILFAGFGAVVIGLGVILLFAYNWAAMHKFAKLAVIFGVMAAAHGAGLVLRRRESLRSFAEAAQLLGTMLFGAGIWLVAQIYHFSAHYSDGFLVWGAGALLLAWLLPSIAHGLLASVLLVIWVCVEAISFGNHLMWAPLLVLVSTGWLAWRERSSVLLAASAISFAVSAVAGFCFEGSVVFFVLLSVAVSYGSLAWLLRGHPSFPSAERVLRVAGMVLYFPLLFILTFYSAAGSLLLPGGGTWQAWEMRERLPMIMMQGVALVLAAWAMRSALRGRECRTPEFRARVMVPTAIFLLCLVWGWLTPWIVNESVMGYLFLSMTLLTTAGFLYHSVAALWRGCRDSRIGQVIGGAFLLGAWVFARYMDLFDSLIARGVIFLVMGCALIALSIFYQRCKQRTRQIPASAAPAATHD